MNLSCSDDLLRYTYQESDSAEKKAVEKRIFGAETAETELFYELLQLKSDLDKLLTEPRRSVVDRIMAYSRRTARQKQPV